jgi:hypothetical protein
MWQEEEALGGEDLMELSTSQEGEDGAEGPQEGEEEDKEGDDMDVDDEDDDREVRTFHPPCHAMCTP